MSVTKHASVPIKTNTEPYEHTPLVGVKDQPPGAWKKEVEILILMLLVIAFGALNKVAGKIMTVPMARFSFFLSLFNGIAYILLYYGILFFRYATGRVSREHLLYPWQRQPITEPPKYTWDELRPPRRYIMVFSEWWERLPPVKYFIISGLMDALGNILGLIATPYLQGPMMSIVSQAIVPFSMISAFLLLGTRYTLYQLLAVTVVIGGALIALIPQFKSGSSISNPIGYLILYTGSNLPSAISFTVKELIFRKKKGLEVFVVNSTGSLFQLLWWPVMVPITLLLNQTHGQPLLDYMREGFQCFAGKTPAHATHDCSADPYPYLVYIVMNLLFNIFLLILLKKASALQGFMAIKAILPIAVILFLIDWPLLGSESVDPETYYSLAVILVGLGLYRWTTILKERAILRKQHQMEGK